MHATIPATNADAAPTTTDWSGLKWGAALALVAAIVYWPLLNNGFIWDDDAYVLNNVQLRTFDGLYNIWFRLGAVPQYYPLVHSTFWLEYHAWGLYPTGYHLTNLALHIGSALLIWRLLLRLSVPGAWLAAAIFAVQPVEVESVAWVTERKNVLSCALALGSLWAYLNFSPPDDARAPRSRLSAWAFYALSLLLFLGALLSKTVTASVPAVLLVITWWKRGRITWRDLAPLVPFFGLGLALAYVTVWMEQTHVGAVGPEWDLSFTERTLIAGRALWFYAGKLFFPYPLIFFYHRWTIDPAVWWQYLFPLAAVGVLVALWLARGRIGRGPLAAALIFGGVLLPALGYFNVYPFRFSFVADHFQYHASIALLALAAAAGVVAFERWTQADSPLRVLAAGGVLLVLGAISQERTRVYRDLVTLYEDTLAKNPTSWAARFNLGESLLTQGKPDEGLREIREAVRLSPEQPWLRTGLASALVTAGDIDEAEAQFRQALAEPLHDVARADALVRLGVLLAQKGNLDEAIDLFRQAIELRPNNSPRCTTMGWHWRRKAIARLASTRCGARWPSRRSIPRRSTAWARCLPNKASWPKPWSILRRPSRYNPRAPHIARIWAARWSCSATWIALANNWPKPCGSIPKAPKLTICWARCWPGAAATTPPSASSKPPSSSIPTCPAPPIICKKPASAASGQPPDSAAFECGATRNIWPESSGIDGSGSSTPSATRLSNTRGWRKSVMP